MNYVKGSLRRLKRLRSEPKSRIKEKNMFWYGTDLSR